VHHQQPGEHGKAGHRHRRPARRVGNRGCLVGLLVVEDGGGHQHVRMAEVHPSEHVDVQRQQHGGADDAQADPSHGATLNQAANAPLTRRPRDASWRPGRTADGAAGTGAGDRSIAPAPKLMLLADAVRTR
jgi:hypothetical protein